VDILDVARWQFGITTVYHFLFVPITIGLSLLVAVMETMWLRTAKPEWLRLAKFFGKLFLINFALGLVTGIVQEFQFGMNWSDYSRFVGDIFGAPLAVEALLAFFLESTFLGIWIFGWDRVPRKLHASCMWLVHIGTLASAWFILAANSWMQHPVGYEYNPDTGRAELTDFWAVMTNKVQLVTFPHVVASAYMTAAAFILGISAWLYTKKRFEQDRSMYRMGIRLGAVVALVAGLASRSPATPGQDHDRRPADEDGGRRGAVRDRQRRLRPVLDLHDRHARRQGREVVADRAVRPVVPRRGRHRRDGRGINDLREQYKQEYGQDPGAAYYSPGDFTPYIPVTYWSFRFMIGLGVVVAAGAALVLWLTRKGRTPTARWFGPAVIALPVIAVLANSFGWIFTEMGRQPWAVFGLMTTAHGVSPGVSQLEAWISIIVLTLLYAVLAIVEVGLLVKYVKKGADPFEEPPNPTLGGSDEDEDRPLAFAY